MIATANGASPRGSLWPFNLPQKGQVIATSRRGSCHWRWHTFNLPQKGQVIATASQTYSADRLTGFQPASERTGDCDVCAIAATVSLQTFNLPQKGQVIAT